MKEVFDDLEVALLLRAKERPGSCKRDIYGPFQSEYSEATLQNRVNLLIEKGFLEAKKASGSLYQVYLTDKARRILKREGRA